MWTQAVMTMAYGVRERRHALGRVAWSDEQAAELAEKVAKAARTGRIGDGKLFVVPTAWDEPLEF